MVLVDFEFVTRITILTRLDVFRKRYFSPRQREVYESVLHCLKEGSKLLKPGVLSVNYEKQMAELVEKSW
jgi:Xaa-Pro aminopeptidase